MTVKTENWSWEARHYGWELTTESFNFGLLPRGHNPRAKRTREKWSKTGSRGISLGPRLTSRKPLRHLWCHLRLVRTDPQLTHACHISILFINSKPQLIINGAINGASKSQMTRSLYWPCVPLIPYWLHCPVSSPMFYKRLYLKQ